MNHAGRGGVHPGTEGLEAKRLAGPDDEIFRVGVRFFRRVTFPIDIVSNGRAPGRTSWRHREVVVNRDGQLGLVGVLLGQVQHGGHSHRTGIRPGDEGHENRHDQKQRGQDDGNPGKYVAGSCTECTRTRTAAKGRAQPAATPLLEQHDEYQQNADNQEEHSEETR